MPMTVVLGGALLVSGQLTSDAIYVGGAVQLATPPGNTPYDPNGTLVVPSISGPAAIIGAPPTAIVENITSPNPDGSYTVGDTIYVDVNFDTAVIVSGAPQLQLNTGVSGRYATYLNGSGTSTLTFVYTVQSGDDITDLDYAGTGSLALNGGSIQDSAHLNVDPTLPTPGQTGSLGANNDLLVSSMLYWDPIVASAGTGTWGLASSQNYWHVGSSTGPLHSWVNGTDAIFGVCAGTPGAIYISDRFNPAGPITPRSLTFAVDGYSIYGMSEYDTLGIFNEGTTIDVVAGSAEIFCSINDVTSSGGGLVKTGAGALILNDTNSYTGSTTISNGVLQLGDGNHTGTLGEGEIINNSALCFDNNCNMAFANDISGSGTVEQKSFSTLILTGNNSYNGGTIFSAGNLAVDSDVRLGNSSGALSFNGGSLQIDGTAFTNTPRTINWSAAGGGFKISDSTNTFTLSSTQNLTGTGTLTKSGTGTLLVNGTIGSNHVTIATLGGTLKLGTSSSLLNSVIVNVYHYGTLDLNGTNNTINTLTMLGGAVTTGSGILTLSDTLYTVQFYSNSISGQLNLTSGTHIFDILGNLEISANISGSGAINTTEISNGSSFGVLTLSGTNTYTGGTIITAGMVKIGNGGTTGSLGSGSVTNNDNLSFNRSDTINISNAISGTGSIINNGIGTLIFTGNNTYSGTTTINAGTLQIGNNNGTTGSLGTGAVIDNGTLAFSRSDSVTLSNTISGSGTLLKNGGTGLLTLTGNNSYSGGTTIYNGNSLSVSSDANLGSGSVNFIGGHLKITGNGFVTSKVFNLGSSASVFEIGNGTLNISGNMIGTGQLVLLSGTLLLNGTSDSNNICIVGGTLKTGASNRFLNTPSIFVTTLLDLNGYNETINNLSAESGARVVSTGTGTLTLQGNITTSGSPWIVAGSINLTSGTHIFDIGLISPYCYPTISANIGGSGGINKTNTGKIALTGNNTYTGTTTISAGILQIGDGGTAGSLGTGAVIDNGTFVFNRSDNVTISNAISGTGSLLKNGTGVLTLTGTKTYTGGTTISQGTLQLGDGTTNGSVAGNIINNAALKFAEAVDLIFSGNISGSGLLSVDINPAETLTFSGTNTYTGDTILNSGTLVFDGVSSFPNASDIIFNGGTWIWG